MRKSAFWIVAVVVGCSLGCARDGSERGTEGLSSVDPPPSESPTGNDDLPAGCELLCQSYDPTECRVVCPPPPPDASVPDDPYVK